MLLPAAKAQDTNASLSGLIIDAQGAAITTATVVVTNTATGVTRTLVDDSNGRYDVQNLPPGPYQVEVSAPGFSKTVLNNIVLTVSQAASQNVTLSVGSNNETVSVEASMNLTQTESSESGALIDNKKVVEMPLSNRQFYSLALLSPGAVPAGQSSTLGFRGGFNVSGAGEATNMFTYNGIYNDAIGTQQPSYRPSVETIQEFKLMTGVYPAQYGKYSGAQVVVLEKSGTNALHGSVYEFIRNEIANAKPYFTRVGARKPAFRQNTFGATLGGPIIKDKTFFFAGYEGQRVNSQTTQNATVPSSSMLSGIFPGTTALYNPYTGQPLTRSADGTYDLKQIPQWTSASAQLGQQIASFFPSGSNGRPAGLVSTPTTAYPSSNFTYSAIQVEKMDEWTVKIDHTISDKDSVHGSYNEFRDPTYQPSNILCGNAAIPYGGCDFNQIVHFLTLQETHLFSPTFLNTFNFGYNRFQMPRFPEDRTLSNLPVIPGVFNNPTPENRGLPNTAVNGYATLGGPTNIPQNQWLNQYEAYDSVNWTKGKHSFQFGLDTFLAITTEVFTQNGRGAFAFNSATIRSTQGQNSNTGTAATATSCDPATNPNLRCYGTTGNPMSDLLLGIPVTATRNPVAPNIHMGNYAFYAYAMDDWKILPNLTLNLGIRYENASPAYDSKNVQSRYNPATQRIELGLGVPNPTDPALLALVDVNAPKFKYLYNFDNNNFAPRVGLAWQPFSKETTVVKGGYGVFYNGPIQFNQYISANTQVPVRTPQTFTAASVTSGTSIPLATVFSGSGTPGFYTAFGAEPKQSETYVQMYSLGVQQQLTTSIVAEINYVGSKGTKLPQARNINTVPLSVTTRNQAARPDPKFGNITYAENANSSNFNSLQTSVRKNLKDGVSFLFAYTWAKSLDYAGGTGSGSNSSGNYQDPRDKRLEYSLSDFNVKHRIVFSPVAELPFGKNKPFLNHGLSAAIFGGFQLSGIFAYQTGRPFTITSAATNRSLTFAGADRPNTVGDPNAGPKTVKQWFNIAAFQEPNSAVFGNTRRNTVIGPDNLQLDVTLARQVKFTERIGAQFRLETFNLPNRPNFFNPFSASAQLPTNATTILNPSTYTGTFGQITNAYDPRQLQAAVRILF
ncbi:TonB-dependent receptor [Terriglobus tenax]|uniref:TonB-dependent receptor n=1 Tax=Terriglobus tenax TaxID=1111115 RepID=UPI0021DFE919|nr:carboxypeptidase-like regulatory domain-containing protein [Terriglobus tenax]